MDLSTLAQRSKAFLHLDDPRTDVPLYHEPPDGAPKGAKGDAVGIWLLSPDSQLFKDRDLARANEVLDQAREARVLFKTADDLSEQQTLQLCDLTLDWNIIVDGKPLGNEEADKRRFYEDERFGWVRLRVVAFVNRRANFIAASSRSSASTPGAASGEASS